MKPSPRNSQERIRKFKISDLPALLIATYKQWMEKEPFQLSAIVAYYAILSLPALIVLILNIVGGIWGREIVQGEILDEITKALGQQTAESIRLMMLDRGDEETSVFTTIIGIGTLLYGATGVFYQLQFTLDKIWNVDEEIREGLWTFLKNRAKAFGFILILGFLLLTSLLITALLSTFVNRLTLWFGDWVEAIFAVDFIISLFFIYFLFAVLFRFLPSRSIAWKAVRLGAAITSLLFLLGKYLLAYYFKTMEPGSTYGAAGSIILIMLWVSYSSLLLFFGAQFTKVYSDRYLDQTPNSK
ncbi:YihY/virulence factor BrkB family protein [Altibacter sp. HG106]|uniref:YihY/virulence factor BrkB family protein n=1 Tax=Altibacter sp. HG106 TaxID=3023937 RepID=UPI002350AF2E|nr:YihY/virulence factor BrkB family protein [Altibacter sp. HG106]MDC7993789.1 YihY/virulence factor BrkB family protein [Altibacter sp. HG106]